jgi:GT2 family glycosyltransferase
VTPAGALREQFLPSAVRSVELGIPIDDLAAGESSTGLPYGDATLLVRLHGEPLGVATVGLDDGRCAAEDLATALWTRLGDRVRAHAARHGCLRPADLSAEALLRGLRPLRERCDTAAPAADDFSFASVIVPTCGRTADLSECLRTLRSLSYPRFEILVVDNCPANPSTRQLADEIRREDPRVRYVAENRPGSSVARNTGVAAARGELVVFTDDDVVVERDWLDWLVQPFVSDTHVDVVTGLVLPGELETQAQRWFEAYGGFGKGFDRRVYDLGKHRENRFLYPYWGGAFGSGNSMAFRRRCLTTIGGFDAALGAGSPARGGADIEAFSHAILQGGRLVYEPRSICWHKHRRDEAALRRQLVAYGAGFTAILTKWVLRDPRLLPALFRGALSLVRSRFVPGAPRLRDRPNLPPELDRLELRGMLLGPALYLRSVLWSHRRGLHAVLPAADGSNQLG